MTDIEDAALRQAEAAISADERSFRLSRMPRVCRCGAARRYIATQFTLVASFHCGALVEWDSRTRRYRECRPC